MKKYVYTFICFMFIFRLVAADNLLLDQPGSYQLMRSEDQVALVYTNAASGMQTMRVLPPTLFPITAIIQSGSITNQDIIQNVVSIAADNVIFNLNGFNLAAGLIIQGRNVKVTNGLIDPTSIQTPPFDSMALFIDNGINILPGSVDIVLEDITVCNATTSILFDNVSGGIVRNCQMILSATGLQLNQSNNIVIEKAVPNNVSILVLV